MSITTAKNSPIQVAIDGPVAAGCSTVARLTAQRLDFLYVDTGAMYRTAALISLRAGIDLEDEATVTELVKKHQIELSQPSKEEQDGRLITVLLDGEDVSWAIRTDEVSKNSAVVAKYPGLRQVLVKKQQQLAAKNNVVMEGRDITYKVLPDAQVKIFLTADQEIRARRRRKQEQSRGKDVTFEEIYQELKARDENDMNRSVDPLQIVPEAKVVDTSQMSINQAVEVIVREVEKVRN